MNLNMQTVKSYLGQAAQTAKELSSQAAVAAKDLSSQVIGAKCLRDYNVQGLTGSAGPGCLWKIFSARSKREGTSNLLASVWIVDKRLVAECSKGNARMAETFLQLCRRDAANLAKLKHPSIVRLLEPFEETRSQLVMVTEAVTASLADFVKLKKASAVDGSGAGSLHLSELEIKHGLVQVAEGMHFLHTQANQIHRGISPEAICVTAGGAWKLSSFGFAVLAEFGSSSPADMSFDYSDSGNCLTAQALKPSLSFTAPELVNSAAGNIYYAADVFSLGLVMYAVIAEQQLLNVNHSLSEYRLKIAALSHSNLSALPHGLQMLLGQMLSTNAAARPSAISVTGSQYFQGDQMLRALQFMDNMIQRDVMQKMAFLTDLTSFWNSFDDRILRLKVLPHLLEEVRSEQLQQIALPLVINILGRQEPGDFADMTAPALAPIFQAAKGDTLLLLIRSAPTLLKCMPRKYVTSMLVPLLAQAADQGDTRCQEEMLKQLPAVAQQTEYATVKAELLPRMHSMCLKTTSASVRANSLTCMARLAAGLHEDEAVKMLQTAGKVSAVDHTASTTMSVMALGEAISEQYGVGIAAKEVLPRLTPLLVLSSLSGTQFASAISITKAILGRIEQKRAKELNVIQSPVAASGMPPISSASGSLQTSVPSWDTEVSSRQSVSGQQQHPAEAAMGVPMPSMQTLSAHTPRSQSSGSATLGHQPSAWPPMPSGLNSGRTAADPFAVFPTSSIHTAASYPARGSSLASGSSLTGNSRGQSMHANQLIEPSSPGDQLANAMHNDNSSNFFADPSWQDPQLSYATQPVVPKKTASGHMQGNAMSISNQSKLQQSAGSGIQPFGLHPAANAVADPFSQLSLSRNTPSTMHQQPHGTQQGSANRSNNSNSGLNHVGSLNPGGSTEGHQPSTFSLI